MLDLLYYLFIAPLEYCMMLAFNWGYNLSSTYGISLILMSIIVNTAVLPIYNKAEGWQEEERQIKKRMSAKEKMIRKAFKGQERFAMLSTLYRQFKYSQWLKLRASIGILLQIPFFFAAYHLLTNMNSLNGVSFGFIKDLGTPDAMFVIGNFSVNVLPILMTAINLFSAFFYSKGLSRRDKIQIYGMALLFLVLLYNSPAALTFYWTMNNVYSLIKNYIQKDLMKREGYITQRERIASIPCIQHCREYYHNFFNAVFTLLYNHLPELTIALTIGLVIPVNQYITNNNEFGFSLGTVLPLFIFVVLLIFTFLLLLYILLKKFLSDNIAKKYNLFCFALLIGIVCQYYMLNANYGLLNGHEIQWEKYRGIAIIDTVFWISCLSLPFFLCKKYSFVKLRKTCSTLCICIISLHAVSTASNLSEFPLQKKINHFLSKDKMLDISSNKNLLVFILDTFDTTIFQHLLKTNPELKTQFADFTFYEDVVGSYPTTVGAIPQILTGKWYKNEQPYRDYISYAWTNNKFYNILNDHNFCTEIYANGRFVESSSPITNIAIGKILVTSFIGVAENFYTIASFSFMPQLLKKYFLIYPSFLRYTNARLGDLMIYNNLKNNPFCLDNNKNHFKLFHLHGAHPPYIYNHNLEKIRKNTSKKSLYEQSLGALKIVHSFILKLKEYGVYDKTALVIMADHGFPLLGSTPLFMSKPLNFSAKQIKISSQPVSYAELHATFLDLLNINNTAQSFGVPFSKQKIENRKRLFLYYTWDDRWNRLEYLPSMFEYQVMGNAQRISSWHYSEGSFLEFKQDDFYEFSKEIVINKNLHNYLYLGWGDLQSNHVWSVGREAACRFNINKGKNKEVRLKLVGYPYLPKDINEQKIRVLANSKEVAEWNMSKKDTYSANIPADYMPTDVLELKFMISNPKAPIEDGVNEDLRPLGFAVENIRIDDLTEADRYELSKEIVINKVLKDYFHNGWGDLESNHVWSVGNEANCRFNINKGKKKELRLNLIGYPYLPKDIKEQKIRVLANGREIAEWNMSKKDTYSANIPADYMPTDVLELKFMISNPKAPKDDGLNEDSRPLGFAVENIRIEEAR